MKITYVHKKNAKSDENGFYKVSDFDYVFEKSNYYHSIDALKEELKTDTINLIRQIIEPNLEIAQEKDTEITQANDKRGLDKKIREVTESVKNSKDKDLNIYVPYPS